MRKVVTDLSPGRSYSIQIRSVSGGTVSQWSPVYLVPAINKVALPPSLVNGDIQVSTIGDKFFANWTYGAIEDDFKNYEYKWLYYDGAAYVESTTIYSTLAPNAELDYATNLKLFNPARPNIKISVRAVDTSGNASAWATSTNPAINAAPAAPTSLSATPAIDTISFFWTAPADNDIDYYELHTGTAGFTPGSGTLVAISSDTNFAYTTTNYTTRVFAVRAVDKFGTPGTKSGEVSSAASQSNNADITPPLTPANFVLTSGTTVQNLANIVATWTKVAATDVSVYRIRYSDVATTGPWQYITVDAKTSAGADIETANIFNLKPSTQFWAQIAAADKSGNISAYSSSSTVTTAANIVAPAIPSAPSASVSNVTGQIQVSHDNTKAAGGSVESDVVRYEVYAGTTTAPTNLIGSINKSTTTQALFNVTATSTNPTWYVRVKAVNGSGLLSGFSTETAATPNLIATANIADAAITNAKIGSLSADKITAGDISAEVITVGTSTGGSPSGIKIDGTNKEIRSQNFATGNIGWRIDSDDSAEFNNLTVRNTFKIEDGVTPVTISAYSRTAGSSNTVFTANGHGYSTGDYVLISGTTDVDTGLTPMVITWLTNNTFSGFPNSATTAVSGSTGSAVKVDNTVRLTNDGLTIGNSGSGVVSIGPTSFQIRSSSTGTRTAIDNTGISVYKSNAQVVGLNSDGTFFLKSATSGNRVELDGDNGLRVKDSDNNTIIKVDPDGLEGYSKPKSISSISIMSASVTSITALAGSSYSTPITYGSSSEGSFTYTAGNIFTAGQTVNIAGFSNTAYNLSNAVVSSSDGSTFTVGAGLLTYPIASYTASADAETVTFTGTFTLNVDDLVSVSDSVVGYNLKNATVLDATPTTFTLSSPGTPDVTTPVSVTDGLVYKLEKSESPTSATASYPGSTYIKTATTEAAHNFPVNSFIQISGASTASEASVKVLSEPSSTTFTYLSLNPFEYTGTATATVSGHRKLTTSSDHELIPGQIFRVTGTPNMNNDGIEVDDVLSNRILVYLYSEGVDDGFTYDGSSPGSTGQITKQTISVNIDDGAATFGGDLKSSSYSTYSLTGSKLSISENDGLKLTREAVQNFILNPTFSNELGFPSSQNWASVASYGLPAVNSVESDSGMGQLAGINSFKSSPIKITSIANTNNSLEKTVTTSVNHKLASPDRVALNGIVYGSITPRSINYKETVSSVTSNTVFKYTPEIGENAFYITSITTSGTTKTVNTSAAHNFVPGQNVWITGTSNSNLNNSSVTTVLTPTTTSFTYVGPDSTSTASDTVTTVTAATLASGTYTFTSTNTYSAGETVTISGVNSNYNITGTIVTANGTQFTMNGTGSANAWSKVVDVTAAIGFSNSVSFTTTNNAFQSGDTVTIAGLSAGFNLNNVTIASAGLTNFTVTTNTLSGQSWNKTSTVSAAISNGTVVTYTVPSGHSISNGSVISITGTSSAFNLSSQLVTGTTATSFSVTPWIGAPAASTWDNAWEISSAEISASQITYTTTSTHQLTAGGLATISNASSSYNITNVPITSASGTTFTVSTTNSAVAWKNTLRIESATGNGSVITYTTSNPHGFYNGQYVTVSGLNASYNVSGAISGASGNTFTIASSATTTPSSWERTVYPTAWSYTSPNLTLTVPNLFSAGNQVYVDNIPVSTTASTFHGNMSIASSTIGQIVLNIGTGQTVITKIISYNPTATASTAVASGSNAVNIFTFAGSGTLNVASTSAFASSGTIHVYATPSGGAMRAFPITYTGKTGTTFTGCNSSGANAVLATNNVVAISTSTISFPLSANTTIPSSSVLSSTGWATTGFFVITDSVGINHLVSYGGISGQSFTNCNSLDSISGTVNAYANIKQQPRIRLNGRFSTQQVGSTKTTIVISSASYNSTTGLRTYTTPTAHGLTVGDPVDVTGLTGTNSSEYNIVEGTIRSVTTSSPFTFVVYAPSPTSAATSSLTGQSGAYTSHASKVQALADVTVTGTSTLNNGTATVSGGTASTTAAVGTVSPSGAISTSSISASFTNSSISSFSSSRRGELSTSVYLPNSTSKAATGSFWVYQNVENSGMYLNMKDFILDDLTTAIPASNNDTTFSQIIPRGSWTRISNIFSLPSNWNPSSTLKLPTLLYADKSFSVTNISGTGTGPRTATTSGNHNFELNQTITISEDATVGFNETANITAIPSPNTFTYTSTASGTHNPTYTYTKATSKSVQVNAIAYYDGAMLTLTNGLTEYFDGDHQGEWQGAKGDSISVKESFTSGQIRLRAGSNISAGEGNYLSEMDKISFSSALPQKVSPSISPISLDIYDSLLGYLPPQTGVALYSGSDTVGKSAYVAVTTNGTTGILSLGGISRIQGNAYMDGVKVVKRTVSSGYYGGTTSPYDNFSTTWQFLTSSAGYFGNVSFVAPPSGCVKISYGAIMYMTEFSGSGTTGYLAATISTSPSGAGTVVYDAKTGQFIQYSIDYNNNFDSTFNAYADIDISGTSSCSKVDVVSGLTSGKTYYLQLSGQRAGTGEARCARPYVVIEPSLYAL